jgi:hypothetical protein
MLGGLQIQRTVATRSLPVLGQWTRQALVWLGRAQLQVQLLLLLLLGWVGGQGGCRRCL